MLLNSVERLLMNNPLRAAVQRYVEVPRLLAMGGAMDGGHALEVGCGNGTGAELILTRFGADHVDAFDLDPKMVSLTERRLARFGDRARVWQGNVTSIDAEDESYDAVFDFGIIHHVPTWRRALGEILRVLRPGGRFYAEEVLRDFVDHPLWRRLLKHPSEDRFDELDFVSELRNVGFHELTTRRLHDHVVWVVATRPPADGTGRPRRA